MIKHLLAALISGGIVLQSCSPLPPFEPHITYSIPEKCVNALPTPFGPLTKEELMTLWGKELYLGVRFASESDWYRAITAFKSSSFLLPKREVARRAQVEFYLFLSYYLAGKYKEAYNVYEESSLPDVKEDFPAKRELYLALSECYEKSGLFEKADFIKSKLSDCDQAEIDLSNAFLDGDLATLSQNQDRSAIKEFLIDYSAQAKSPQKAKFFQAVLPGAGYYYVDQKKAAVTSLVINALFIAAATQFWKRGYIAASLITWSLETGWYFGGINGAGLAANEFNERLFEGLGKETMIKERLFPILRFDYAF